MSENSASKTARVHYTGTLADGTVFDTSRERDPFEFVVGAGQVIKGFDDAVVGMAVGDTKTVTVQSDDAYGPHFAERVIEVEMSKADQKAFANSAQAVADLCDACAEIAPNLK